MNNSTIIDLFSSYNNEKLASNYLPKDVVNSLGFKDSLRLAYRLLYNKNWETDLQRYAIQLIQSVKSSYRKEWEQDWRFEAYLGSAYDLLLGEDSNFDKRYEAFKQAFEMSKSPPPELIIALATCYDAPGIPPISLDEAIDLAKKSIELEPYADAAGILCSAYFCKHMQRESNEWKKIRDELSEAGKNAPPLEPAFVREGYV